MSEQTPRKNAGLIGHIRRRKTKPRPAAAA